MRATMELHGDALHYPPIHAQVALGNEDLTVKVGLGRQAATLLCEQCSLREFHPVPSSSLAALSR